MNENSPSRSLALIRRVVGPLWFYLGFTAVLEVPGRRSAAPLHVTLFPVEVDGTTYLLSQYGSSNWVRNLRAAGQGRLRHKDHTEGFTSTEVDGAERDRVIASFRARVPKPLRRDYERLPAAADHPTFRVQPIA